MYWIAFGDVHENTGVLPLIPELPGAAGVIVTGDLTNHGTTESARHVLDAIAAVNPAVLAQIGNMDTGAVGRVLHERGINLHAAVRELAPGLGLMGVGYSTPTPFDTPSEVSDQQMGQWLHETHALAKDFDRLILAVHTPPVNTVTDRISNGMHVGSASVRTFIERVQPDLVLTGHIHEAVGTDLIGRTPVINPGMLAGGGYVVVTFENGELTAELKSV